MYETGNPEEIAQILRTSCTDAISGIIAIDGRDGVGKTRLATVLQKSVGGIVISLDSFLEKNRGGYVPYLKTDELNAALRTPSRPIIIEGVCMLAALERIRQPHQVLIYVKRLIDGYYWFDEDTCDPAEPVEEFIARRADENRSFARLDAELSGKPLPTGETPGLTPLREEIIRYHAQYRPSRHAESSSRRACKADQPCGY